jgi:hypothetical protein
MKSFNKAVISWAFTTAMLTIVSGSMLIPTEAMSQKTVDVFFVHTPYSDPSRIRLSYSMPGWDTTRVAGGLSFGDRLTIMQGGKMCFRIRNANPMLYAYGTTSEIIKVSPQDGFADVIAKLASGGFLQIAMGKSSLEGTTAFLPTRPGRGLASAEEPSPAEVAIENYSDSVSRILTILASLEAIRLRDEGDWQREMSDQSELQNDARIAREAADKMIKAALNTTLSSADKNILTQLNKLQVLSVTRTAAIGKEFADANKQLDTPLCTSVDANRMKAKLTVKGRLSEVKDLKYAVKDDLVELELEPRSDAAFEVGAGAMIGSGVKRQKFSVKDGIIAADTDDDPIIRPGLFAMGRLWPLGWLWGSIGVSKGEEATPDLFFGLVARPGISLAGVQLSIGGGLGLFQVPVGLKKGEVGKALPDDIGDIEKVIDRGYRSGLSVTFSLSGFDVPSPKKK